MVIQSASGVIDEELNGENIVSVPLQVQGDMHIGMVTHKKSSAKPSGGDLSGGIGTVYATENIIDKNITTGS